LPACSSAAARSISSFCSEVSGIRKSVSIDNGPCFRGLPMAIL
jgi:hypothetical protein